MSLFIAEADRLQRKDGFVGFIHGLDCLLEASRGSSNAQLASGVHYYRASSHWHPRDAGNKGLLLCSLLTDADGVRFAADTKDVSADIDVITAGGDIGAGGPVWGG